MCYLSGKEMWVFCSLFPEVHSEKKKKKCPLKQLFSKSVPGLTAAALLGNALEMPLLRAQPRQNQTFWDSGPEIYILPSLTNESVHIFCLRVGVGTVCESLC